MGTPTASNSFGNSPPTPTPTETRPPERESMSASCLATTTGWYSGSRRIAVPIRTRSVHAARRAKRTMASPVPTGGSRWPPCQTDSMGRRSTASSQSRSGSGRAAAPMMIRSVATSSASRHCPSRPGIGSACHPSMATFLVGSARRPPYWLSPSTSSRSPSAVGEHFGDLVRRRRPPWTRRRPARATLGGATLGGHMPVLKSSVPSTRRAMLSWAKVETSSPARVKTEPVPKTRPCPA